MHWKSETGESARNNRPPMAEMWHTATESEIIKLEIGCNASGNQLSMRDVMLFGPATKTPQENTNTVEMRTGKVILEAPPLHSYVPGGCLPSFRTRYHNAKDVDHLVHSSDAYASR